MNMNLLPGAFEDAHRKEDVNVLNVKFKNLAGVVLVSAGIVAIICMLPFWVLNFIMGTILVIIGILLLALC